jgi:hypothetical protein
MDVYSTELGNRLSFVKTLEFREGILNLPNPLHCPGSELLSIYIPQGNITRSRLQPVAEQSILVSDSECYSHLSAVGRTMRSAPHNSPISSSQSSVGPLSPDRFVGLPGSTRRNHVKDVVFVSSARQIKVQVSGHVVSCLLFDCAWLYV